MQCHGSNISNENYYKPYKLTYIRKNGIIQRSATKFSAVWEKKSISTKASLEKGSSWKTACWSHALMSQCFPDASGCGSRHCGCWDCAAIYCCGLSAAAHLGPHWIRLIYNCSLLRWHDLFGRHQKLSFELHNKNRHLHIILSRVFFSKKTKRCPGLQERRLAWKQQWTV